MYVYIYVCLYVYIYIYSFLQHQQKLTKRSSGYNRQQLRGWNFKSCSSRPQYFPTFSKMFFAESNNVWMFVHPSALRLCTNSTQRSDVEGSGLRQRLVLILPQSWRCTYSVFSQLPALCCTVGHSESVSECAHSQNSIMWLILHGFCLSCVVMTSEMLASFYIQLVNI